MELKYVILTIIKILISVPAIVMVMSTNIVNAAVLMGGHLDNSPNWSNLNSSKEEMVTNGSVLHKQAESIPDPAPLVVPGYNLPENIFNKGKPFYLEKDPLTGKVDFNSKSPLSDVQYDDELEYDDVVQQDPSIYEKSNIDRKDGNVASHNTDVNQLTSNFHDFLNLPVKYNPEKYVYPLISSSYANTKVQGNIYQYNHKNYDVTTYKPTVSPTYYFTPKPSVSVSSSMSPTTTTTTTRLISTTKKSSSSEPPHLIGAMNHPSFYYTTENPNHLTSKFTTAASTTTRRTLGFLEQLFGEYDEMAVTESPLIKAPSLFHNLPNNKNKKYEDNKIMPTEYEYIDDYPTEKAIAETKSSLPEVPSTISTRTSTSTTTRITTTTTPKLVFASSIDPLVTEDTDTDLDTEFDSNTFTTSTTKVTSLPLGENKVTSLPLGENHFPPVHVPIITVTNLKEKLNNEKVTSKPYVANLNNARVPIDQDKTSFVIGNQQKIVGSSFKAAAYDNVPFRPLIVQPNNNDDMVSYSVQATPTFSQTFNAEPKIPETSGMSSATIQPIKNSETSLSIGVPLGDKKIPGQVEDANLDSEIIKFPKKSTGAKIVFPNEIEINPYNITPSANREILQLKSQPMYHQLPSDLTPPSDEQDLIPPPLPAARPPWDPRPGHFYNGRPEYSRPPRPSTGEIYKRIDKLPNILPQFRPNVKSSGPHHYDYPKNGYLRQPLLDRPSNRPIGYFEKLIPPPPPPINIQNLRKVAHKTEPDLNEQYDFYQYQTPPQPVLKIASRRTSDPTIETLQMIQSKKVDKANEKPVYVVYPVNTASIKLDALDIDKKETVVVGTRAESPLPPSKISEFTYESPKERNDAPILKPHPKPSNFPIKSDFPYPLEKPGNTLDSIKYPEIHDVEARIVTGSKINHKSPNQISVTLKTFTEKPIAIAYSPTETHRKPENTEKYSMPNYASPVISEIRPDSEITVSAVMHAQSNKINVDNHRKTDFPVEPSYPSLGFQAPFQASMNIDTVSQGWTVVKNKEKLKIDRSDQESETTTLSVATTSEFDMEKFKPELFGGFKPIYKYPEEGVTKSEETEVKEREEH